MCKTISGPSAATLVFLVDGIFQVMKGGELWFLNTDYRVTGLINAYNKAFVLILC